MNWTQVDIYTATPAIDLLSVRLQDLGIRGCMVQDAQDFQEFLEQKDGKWDYLEDGLMELASCETCVTVYLPEDAQGAEMLAALRTMLAQMKAEDTGNSISSRFRWETSCTSSPAGKNPPQKPPAEPFWRSIRQAASAPDSTTPHGSVWN